MSAPFLTTGCHLLHDRLVYIVEVFFLQAWEEVRIDNLEYAKPAVRIQREETSHSIFCLCELPPGASFGSFLDCLGGFVLLPCVWLGIPLFRTREKSIGEKSDL